MGCSANCVAGLAPSLPCICAHRTAPTHFTAATGSTEGASSTSARRRICCGTVGRPRNRPTAANFGVCVAARARRLLDLRLFWYAKVPDPSSVPSLWLSRPRTKTPRRLRVQGALWSSQPIAAAVRRVEHTQQWQTIRRLSLTANVGSAGAFLISHPDERPRVHPARGGTRSHARHQIAGIRGGKDVAIRVAAWLAENRAVADTGHTRLAVAARIGHGRHGEREIARSSRHHHNGDPCQVSHGRRCRCHLFPSLMYPAHPQT